ncbi:helical backbone metal receptor [Novosphingobium sp.]|uniref:helical backbone metal receptor n=1 Tax=Novosphingobium sp. TaxID=1874826 RepID=UPI002FD91A98
MKQSGALVLSRWGMIAPFCAFLTACAQSPVPSGPAAHFQVSVVSLNPCTDAILAEVTTPGQLLAISHFSHDPAASSMEAVKAARFAETSGAVEEVAALAPDVVVASTFLDPATQQALRDMGMRVVMVPIPVDVATSEAQVRELADLAGNPDAGEALVARIESALANAASPAEEKPVPALVWESGGIVSGDHTLIADLLRRSGFANAAAARELSQADYLPLERMLAQPPRVIFTVGDARSQGDRMLSHPALDTLKGVARAPIDSALLWCGGPTIPRALKRLAQVRAAADQGQPAHFPNSVQRGVR